MAKRTISDKILKDRAYEIARNPKYDGYQRVFTSIIYKYFHKKTGLGVSVNVQLIDVFPKYAWVKTLNEINYG